MREEKKLGEGKGKARERKRNTRPKYWLDNILRSHASTWEAALHNRRTIKVVQNPSVTSTRNANATFSTRKPLHFSNRINLNLWIVIKVYVIYITKSMLNLIILQKTHTGGTVYTREKDDGPTDVMTRRDQAGCGKTRKHQTPPRYETGHHNARFFLK